MWKHIETGRACCVLEVDGEWRANNRRPRSWRRVGKLPRRFMRASNVGKRCALAEARMIEGASGEHIVEAAALVWRMTNRWLRGCHCEGTVSTAAIGVGYHVGCCLERLPQSLRCFAMTTGKAKPEATTSSLAVNRVAVSGCAGNMNEPIFGVFSAKILKEC